MANRRPLVNNAGRASEIPSGDGLVIGASAAPATVSAAALTAARTAALPDKSGTLAMLTETIYQRGAQFYNNGSVLVAADANEVDVPIIVSGTITRIRITTKGGTGSCVIDVWRDSFANYPPTVADTIFSAGKPTISSGIKYEDTTLTGVSTAVVAGQHLFFKLDSSSVFTRVSVYVEITPS